MRPRRRLALRREELSDLAGDELGAVVGGTHIATDCGCVTHGLSCERCPTPTLPINVCVELTLEVCVPVVTTILPTRTCV